MFDNKFKNLLLNLQMTKDSKNSQLCFLLYIMAGITLKTDNVEHMLSESQLQKTTYCMIHDSIYMTCPQQTIREQKVDWWLLTTGGVNGE